MKEAEKASSFGFLQHGISISLKTNNSSFGKVIRIKNY
jgi:hypothetical protein